MRTLVSNRYGPSGHNDTATILIAGPTACGKSQLAMQLAREQPSVIINADSMQVYNDLRVLTARPSAAHVAGAPHHLYGHIDGGDAYSVGRWLSDVEDVLASIAVSGRRAIFVGGTGLYFKALIEGLSPIPDVPDAVRDHIRQRAEQLSASELHADLARRDPVMAGRLPAGDRQRIVRALEVVVATGRSLSHWQATPGRPLLTPEDISHRLVVAPPRELIYSRCDARLEHMWRRGAVEEADRLLARGLSHDRPVMRALGVREIAAWRRGEISEAEALARAQTETRRYAKRQLTWLRGNMMSWTWLKGEEMQQFLQ